MFIAGVWMCSLNEWYPGVFTKRQFLNLFLHHLWWLTWSLMKFSVNHDKSSLKFSCTPKNIFAIISTALHMKSPHLQLYIYYIPVFIYGCYISYLFTPIIMSNIYCVSLSALKLVKVNHFNWKNTICTIFLMHFVVFTNFFLHLTEKKSSFICHCV